jgi:hypothetical protein
MDLIQEDSYPDDMHSFHHTANANTAHNMNNVKYKQNMGMDATGRRSSSPAIVPPRQATPTEIANAGINSYSPSSQYHHQQQ